MKVLKLIASFVISYSAALIGGLATTANIPTWYAALDKPPLNPPNWIFGPVWSLLYTLIAISLYLAWTAETKKPKTKAYVVFAAQMVLNALWSLVFFGLHQTWLAVAVILLLIVSIIVTIVQFKQYSKPAAWLLAPYLVWVCFATYLTIGIAVVQL
ncbi:tryptophan-rich sensory protein [Candidatus Saccharibacteria bacterium]|nr:MAG: tryptophan-rich sensory protein [Candidatus Saccharibacteria bacterium]